MLAKTVFIMKPLEFYEGSGSVSESLDQLIKYDAVCRTALATRGLLNRYFNYQACVKFDHRDIEGQNTTK